MTDIAIRELRPQHVACVAARCEVAAIPAKMAEMLPEAWHAVTACGMTPAGPPYARYFGFGPEVSFEAGVPVDTPFAGSGRVVAGELPGGSVAVAVHLGPYETLGDTYAELERWIAAAGRSPVGPMWESYVTNPDEERDQASWRTEIFQPIA